MSALEIFVHTDEGEEGAQAFAEKRPADFAPLRHRLSRNRR
jgi:1,4-dihydroxy-2-naphthoyl-CoA synthase